VPDDLGRTPLSHALNLGDREIAEMLVSLGATNMQGSTPERALASGIPEVAVRLAESAVDDGTWEADRAEAARIVFG
jgi:ankyrin repeat protein